MRLINGLIPAAPFSQFVNEEKIDFVNMVPEEITHKIFSYLKISGLATCCRVNKAWKVLASDEALWNAFFSSIIFGKKQWTKYYGEIGQEPPLPQNIYKILNSPCPFWLGKKIEETHFLVLIPETVNEKTLNFETLKELVQAPKAGHATKFDYIDTSFNKPDGNQSTVKSHWVLMTRDVIEGSRNKSYEAQKVLMSELNTKKGMNYEFPSLLDAAICIFMRYVSSGKRLFGDEYMSSSPYIWTYTNCQESPFVIGNFTSNGLCISLSYKNSTVGAAAMRNFKPFNQKNSL